VVSVLGTVNVHINWRGNINFEVLREVAIEEQDNSEDDEAPKAPFFSLNAFALCKRPRRSPCLYRL
ncbi:hypothetical protein A2U01_0016798, partial [Trifolium medium]|nr:hypothetical protein [Trifolium medium]